jgi:hypothetical protein
MISDSMNAVLIKNNLFFIAINSTNRGYYSTFSTFIQIPANIVKKEVTDKTLKINQLNFNLPGGQNGKHLEDNK